MKINIFKLWIFITLIQSSTHGELLIVVKDTATGLFRAMTNEETLKYQSKISDTLLKYQWPMCIQSDLTPTEIDEYLAPNKPYAQEKFIQKKINESINRTEIDLHVMFVPDSFYQLFCIAEQSYNKFHDQYKTALKINNIHVMPFHTPQIKPIDPLSYKKIEAQANLKKSFEEVNTLFFKSEQEMSPLSSINNRLVEYIFNAYPEVCHQASVIDLSNALEPKLEELKVSLCNNMAENDDYKKTVTSNGIPPQASNYFKLEPQTHIISNVMKIEYEARSLNKSLILRGTDVIEEDNLFRHQTEFSIMLAGSTINQSRSFQHSLLETQDTPYSISYGNSLFAGFYQDPGGCVYTYLNGRKSDLADSDVIGYGLLIDQQAYLKYPNTRLFYIPSLSPLTSLFERGQYCHPRSRVAVIDKNKISKIEGIRRANEEGLIDPADIIVFEGNPIKHEEKFSRFLAQDGRLIRLKDDANLNPPTQSVTQEIMNSQKKVAQAHQEIRVLGKKILRRLMRAGSQPIPEISELKLFKIFKYGPTEEEYIQLQKSLSSLQLKPLTKEIAHMSNNDLYKNIIKERMLQTPENPTDLYISEKIELWNENPLFISQNLNEILKILDVWMQHASKEGKRKAYGLIIQLILNNKITTDNVNTLFLMTKSWIESSDENIHDYGNTILREILTRIPLNTDQIDHALQIFTEWATSSKLELQLFSIKTINCFCENYKIPDNKINSLLPIILKISKTLDSREIQCIQTLTSSKKLSSQNLNQIVNWANQQHNTEENLYKYCNIFKKIASYPNLTSDTIHKIFEFMDSINLQKIYIGILYEYLEIIKILVQNHNIESNNDVNQITKWLNHTISNLEKTSAKYILESIVDIIDSLVKQKLLKPSYIENLLTKHTSLWSEKEKIRLQTNLETLKSQEATDKKDFIESTKPEISTSKQSMMDFALHGTGGLHRTNKNLMRFYPEAQPSEFTPPSFDQLTAQRKQMEQFNAQREQQIYHQAMQLEQQRQLELQHKEFNEQAQRAKIDELTPYIRRNQLKLGRTVARSIK